jgi:DNA-binding MarR family transcriptional regulator
MMDTVRGRKPQDEDYRRLLEFRTGLRRFIRWSEELAATADLTPTQHQLLLCVRGHPRPDGPTISEVTEYLLLAHNTVVELVDRAQGAELLRRVPDATDRRAVRLVLTERGKKRLESLAMATMEELSRFFPQMDRLWRDLR